MESTVAGAVGLKSVDPKSPINEYFGYLEQAIEDVNQAAGELIQRVSNVLRPELGGDMSEPTMAKPEDERSQVVEEIAEKIEQLHNIRRRLNAVILRVQL